MLSVPDRILIVMRHKACPMTTREVSREVREISGIVSARMLRLVGRGQVVRVNEGAGRGKRAKWAIPS